MLSAAHEIPLALFRAAPAEPAHPTQPLPAATARRPTWLATVPGGDYPSKANDCVQLPVIDLSAALAASFFATSYFQYWPKAGVWRRSYAANAARIIFWQRSAMKSSKRRTFGSCRFL